MTDNGEVQYFSYDALGNITTYKGTNSTAPSNLNWTRRNMLGGGNLRGQAFEYKYGPDNLRYSKKVSGTETIYYWDGDILMGEKTGNNVTQYLYDSSGIVGMIYNKNYYYFEKNLYGDVLRVYNSSGGLAASFTYDSYGNQLSASGSMADKVHFRYRGYYYDEETGFYYLQSRYYDPSICRFISADQYELVGTLSNVVGQLNLYAYCNDNPIMYTDPSGEIVLSTALIIIGAVAGVIAGGYIGYQAVVNDPTLTTSQKLASIGLCAILGGIAGGFFGVGLGYALPAMISGGIGSATEAALVGAVAISLEEAVIMGVAVGVGASAAGGGNSNISYSKSYDMPKYGEPGSTIYEHGSIGQYDSNGHLIARKDFSDHYVKSVGKDCNPHTHVYKWWKYNGIWRWKEITVLPF